MMREYCSLIFFFFLTCKIACGTANDNILQVYLEDILSTVAPDKEFNHLFWLHSKLASKWSVERNVQVNIKEGGTFEEIKQGLNHLHVKHTKQLLFWMKQLNCQVLSGWQKIFNTLLFSLTAKSQ